MIKVQIVRNQCCFLVYGPCCLISNVKSELYLFVPKVSFLCQWRPTVGVQRTWAKPTILTMASTLFWRLWMWKIHNQQQGWTMVTSLFCLYDLFGGSFWMILRLLSQQCCTLAICQHRFRLQFWWQISL